MAVGGLLIGGVMMVTVGASMLGVGIYVTGTLFNSLNITNNSAFYDQYGTSSQYNVSTAKVTALSDAQTNTFTAFKILGISLIVGGFSVIIGTLLTMVSQ